MVQFLKLLHGPGRALSLHTPQPLKHTASFSRNEARHRTRPCLPPSPCEHQKIVERARFSLAASRAMLNMLGNHAPVPQAGEHRWATGAEHTERLLPRLVVILATLLAPVLPQRVVEVLVLRPVPHLEADGQVAYLYAVACTCDLAQRHPLGGGPPA
eukprot:4008816-Prymnesium_polylepis.3